MQAKCRGNAIWWCLTPLRNVDLAADNRELRTNYFHHREYGRYSIVKFHFIEVLKHVATRRLVECSSLQIHVSCVVSSCLGSRLLHELVDLLVTYKGTAQVGFRDSFTSALGFKVLQPILRYSSPILQPVSRR
jgi:hypothetical protein